MESPPPNPGPSPAPAAARFDLSQVYVHLGLGARAETLPDFTWSEEYLRRYEADHEADGDEGRLVMIGPDRRPGQAGNAILPATKWSWRCPVTRPSSRRLTASSTGSSCIRARL